MLIDDCIQPATVEDVLRLKADPANKEVTLGIGYSLEGETEAILRFQRPETETEAKARLESIARCAANDKVFAAIWFERLMKEAPDLVPKDLISSDFGNLTATHHSQTLFQLRRNAPYHIENYREAYPEWFKNENS